MGDMAANVSPSDMCTDNYLRHLKEDRHIGGRLSLRITIC